MHDDDNNAIGSPSSSFRKSLMERRKPVHEVHDLYMQAARVGSSDAKVKQNNNLASAKINDSNIEINMKHNQSQYIQNKIQNKSSPRRQILAHPSRYS